MPKKEVKAKPSQATVVQAGITLPAGATSKIAGHSDGVEGTLVGGAIVSPANETRSVAEARVTGSAPSVLGSIAQTITETVKKQDTDETAVAEARRILNDAAIGAAKTIISLSRDGMAEDRIQLQACQDILDRAGLRPVEVTEVRQRTYTLEEVTAAKAVTAETEAILKEIKQYGNNFILEVEHNTASKAVTVEAASAKRF